MAISELNDVIHDLTDGQIDAMQYLLVGWPIVMLPKSNLQNIIFNKNLNLNVCFECLN